MKMIKRYEMHSLSGVVRALDDDCKEYDASGEWCRAADVSTLERDAKELAKSVGRLVYFYNFLKNTAILDKAEFEELQKQAKQLLGGE
jgi:hypothetical protein